MVNYIVLDLEMCMIDKYLRTCEYNMKHEIIQIGSVKLNDRFEEVSRFSTFVKPKYGSVNTFIKDLTGITRGNVARAEELSKAIEVFLNWVGDGEAFCVSWSMSDKYQLKKEMKAKGIVNERLNSFYSSWIDCQKLFADKARTVRCWNLSEALNASGIEPKGHTHNGLMDSINTAALFKKLMTEDDFKMVKAYEKARYAEVDHLCVPIGDLLDISDLTIKN